MRTADAALGRRRSRPAALRALRAAAAACRRSTNRSSTSCFHWVVLATSWNILSGYSGYFSFGHGAFFGAGVYTTATLAGKLRLCRFSWTLPAAAAVAALLGVALGAVVFRVRRVRGELFALLTLAVTFVLGHHRAQHADRRRARHLPERGAGAAAGADATGALLSAGAGRRGGGAADRLRCSIRGSASGLFAIHDDEDVAEVMGVPTFRYKLAAFGSRARWPASPAASTRCSSPT